MAGGVLDGRWRPRYVGAYRAVASFWSKAKATCKATAAIGGRGLIIASLVLGGSARTVGAFEEETRGGTTEVDPLPTDTFLLLQDAIVEAEFWYEIAERRKANLMVCAEAYEACVEAPAKSSLLSWWVPALVVAALATGFVVGSRL